MNEQLQQALAQILNRTVEGIDAGTQFLSAQLPDVIQQLLIWKFWYHLIVMVAPLVVLAVLGTALYKVVKAIDNHPLNKANRLIEQCRKRWDMAPARSDEERAAHTEWKAARAARDQLTDNRPTLGAAATVLGVATFITTFITAYFVNLTWLQILVAPKIYLIEYAASFAK